MCIRDRVSTQSTGISAQDMRWCAVALLLLVVVNTQEPVTLEGDAECPSDRPFLSEQRGVSLCVNRCPSGQGRLNGTSNECMACDGAKPFADHRTHTCVAHCGPHRAPNAQHSFDCEACEDPTPYADHQVHRCVERCPPGTVITGGIGWDQNDCKGTHLCQPAH
eukprot:TRINITY_DN4360_c0_g1_i2.p1 TRINITY_DN4360_c0_g1~~TRINITY_DN4360_c0_g1_i2.p1  ORF type:complete len:164 (+),score=21.73 TRINITY_DN4360_c0_g1_i2:176-667(+)